MDWLYGILKAFDWQYTPLEVLQTEDAYPGIWDDLFTIQWIESLIKEALKSTQ